MKTSKLTSAVMSIPQWVIIGVIALGIAVMLLALAGLVYILIYKPELRAELKNTARIYRGQKKLLITETERAEAEIRRSAKEIEEKAERARQLNSETERLRQELIAQGVQEAEAKRIADMSLEQLLVLKSKEARDVSGNYIINAITRRVLIDSEFERRGDVEDFKVPLNKTMEYTVEAVESGITALAEITHTRKGRPAADCYEVLGRQFAMLLKQGDGFLLKIKCGTYYGQRLKGLYPGIFDKAKFPAQMLWFQVNEGCSLELVRLLTEISYNIAKAGY